MKVRKLKPRNPTVVPVVRRSGAGKHRNKKREDKHNPKKETQYDE